MGEMLSQDEINALLGGGDNSGGGESSKGFDTADNAEYSNLLSVQEKDILGEFANISMGTAATTLSTLLNQKVTIDTPSVRIMSWDELKSRYQLPFVGIKVDYREGLKGSNIMVLQEEDVKSISGLMMGGDGKVEEGFKLTDLDLSAISEAMNQMVGSASTSLSSMIKIKIDINTPQAYSIDLREETFFETVGFRQDEIVVCIYFQMKIGTIIDSQIMQIINIDFAKEMVELAITSLDTGDDAGSANTQSVQPQAAPPIAAAPLPVPEIAPGYAQPQHQPPPYPYPAPGAYPGYPPPPQPAYGPAANVAPAHFKNFDAESVFQQKENIEIIMDVPLEVSVELGRTRKRIKEILEFAPGTIVELDKLAGEPIDVLVNGKFVAKGEVVVIDEKFGIRVTDIINPEHRI